MLLPWIILRLRKVGKVFCGHWTIGCTFKTVNGKMKEKSEENPAHSILPGKIIGI